MIIVSDTSPVSNLILIQRLEILQKLFSEIIVPLGCITVLTINGILCQRFFEKAS